MLLHILRVAGQLFKTYVVVLGAISTAVPDPSTWQLSLLILALAYTFKNNLLQFYVVAFYLSHSL